MYPRRVSTLVCCAVHVVLGVVHCPRVRSRHCLLSCRSAGVHLASSDLFHMYLALAGLGFHHHNFYYYRHYYCLLPRGEQSSGYQDYNTTWQRLDDRSLPKCCSCRGQSVGTAKPSSQDGVAGKKGGGPRSQKLGHWRQHVQLQ